MTAIQSTDLTANIAALNRVLADVTKECPYAIRATEISAEIGERVRHEETLKCNCQGTGLVARFKGFRQDCNSIAHRGGNRTCLLCNGTSWHVRAGGLEDGLAGLTVDQIREVLEDLQAWVMQSDLTPSAPEILLKGLELVCEVAGLEVPDA